MKQLYLNFFTNKNNSAMNFLELARARYSVRSFSTQPVEKDKLYFILQSGQLAPTAVNYQP